MENQEISQETIAQLKIDEGFRSRPYQCSVGVWTFGYGTTWISEEEAEMLLINRVESISKQLNELEFYQTLSDERKSVIQQMVYQLGFAGVIKFKNMIKAIEDKNFYKASREMLNSRWANQTPNRAKRLAKQMKTGEIK